MIDVLNGALALIAARKIEIDVGPLASFFGKEALEQQLHLHRIDCSDSKRVTHSAVRRRAAALNEDVVFQAELDDVPNNKEIAVKTQLPDERELALDLAPRLIIVRTKTAKRAFLRALPKKRSHRLALAHGIFRKLVAEILQRELKPARKLDSIGDGFRQVAKEPRHLRGRLEMTLGVFREQTSGGFQGSVISNAGEDVEDLALVWRGVTHAVRGQQREPKCFGQRGGLLVDGFFFAIVVPLKFDAYVFAAEDGN